MGNQLVKFTVETLLETAEYLVNTNDIDGAEANLAKAREILSVAKRHGKKLPKLEKRYFEILEYC